ncbi:MAG: hypothetical protein RDU76_01845 [Candidatus Edwardsbacteria bacterium]|nr:hypothetical protein [Candidatus Edwardsbacteria bacterium]
MKLVDFIICDDIRFEIGEKHTLVGLYGDINFTQRKGQKPVLPAMIKLGIFIRCIVDKKAENPDAFLLELLHDTKGKLAQVEGALVIPEAVKYINLALVNNYVIPDVGKIIFKLHLFKEKKEVDCIEPVYTFEVKIIEEK